MSAHTTHRRVIRPARPGDAAGCLSIYAPFVRESAVSFETEVPAVEAFERRIRETMRVYPWLVCEVDGGIAGYAYARRHRRRAAYRWSVEVSVFVADGHRRHGLGRAIYEELFDILKRQGFANAYAGIALPNPASVSFHEALGFEPVGVYDRVGFKLGHWHDVGWWTLRLAEGDGRPADPVPYPDLPL